MRRQMWLAVWLFLPICLASSSAALAERTQPTGDRSVVEQIEDTAKKMGSKIEQGFSKTAKKIEDKHIVDKVERKLKKAATKTAEGFKKAGEKIDQKLQ